MAKFKVGDKVISIAPVGHEGVTGAYGEIVAIDLNDYRLFLVKFDQHIGGHDGYGECNERGWWCASSDIKLVKEDVRMFTKKDLKNGDMVKLRNGTIGIILLGIDCLLTAETGGYCLKYVKNDLTHDTYSDRDIVAVYRTNNPEMVSFRSFNRDELVYERKEVEEMTLEEVCKALGKEIKIVKEK